MRTGRPPKPDGQKINHHPPTHDSVVLGEGRKKPPPPVVELTTEGVKLWKALWSQPEASQWTDADVPTLSRLAWLLSSPANWADSKLLAEMRQLEDRFGLSPYARRQLRWVRAEVEPEQERRTATTVERRGRLKVV